METQQKLNWLLVAVLLSCVGCLPYAVVYLTNLWQQPHYQFFPVLLIAVGWMFWQRRGGLLQFGIAWKLFATVVLLGGAFGVLCATAFASPWMGYFGFAASATAGFAMTRDRSTGRSLVYLGLPVFLIWQPPYNTIITADTVLIQQLQTVSAKLSSRWLDSLGYLHFQPGTVLEFAGKSFGVAEACSGIQSFFAVVCFASLLCAFFRRGPLHTVLLMATSPIWAVLMNTIRITAIPIAYSALGVDLSHGLIHDLLGFGTMGLAIVLLISADELLLKLAETFEPFMGRWLGVIRPAEAAGHVPATAFSWAAVREMFTALPKVQVIALGCFALPFVGMFCLQANDAYTSWGMQKKTIDFFRDEPLIQMSVKDAPESLQGWRRVNYIRENRARDNDDLGQQSDLWYYDNPKGRTTVSFDQMFPGWHELTRCYRSAGWKLERRVVLSSDTAGKWPIVEAYFSRSGEYGYLLWSLKTRDGKAVQPPGEWNPWTSLKERLQNRLTPAVRGALFGLAAYQIQMFVSDSAPMDEAGRAECVSRFLEVRPVLWDHAERRLVEMGLTD